MISNNVATVTLFMILERQFIRCEKGSSLRPTANDEDTAIILNTTRSLTEEKQKVIHADTGYPEQRQGPKTKEP